MVSSRTHSHHARNEQILIGFDACLFSIPILTQVENEVWCERLFNRSDFVEWRQQGCLIPSWTFELLHTKALGKWVNCKDPNFTEIHQTFTKISSRSNIYFKSPYSIQQEIGCRFYFLKMSLLFWFLFIL